MDAQNWWRIAGCAASLKDKGFSSVTLYFFGPKIPKRVVGALEEYHDGDFSVERPSLPKLPSVHWWAYPKLFVASQFREPYMMIDIDAWLDKPVPEDILKAHAFCQYHEGRNPHGATWVDKVCERAKEHGIGGDIIDNDTCESWNVGVVGGNDVDALNLFCKNAMSLYEGCYEAKMHELGTLNHYCEQLHWDCHWKRDGRRPEEYVKPKGDGWFGKDWRGLHHLMGHKYWKYPKQQKVVRKASADIFKALKDSFFGKNIYAALEKGAI